MQNIIFIKNVAEIPDKNVSHFFLQGYLSVYVQKI